MWDIHEWSSTGCRPIGDVMLQVAGSEKEGGGFLLLSRPLPCLLHLLHCPDAASANGKASLVAAWRLPSDVCAAAACASGLLAVATIDGRLYSLSYEVNATEAAGEKRKEAPGGNPDPKRQKQGSSTIAAGGGDQHVQQRKMGRRRVTRVSAASAAVSVGEEKGRVAAVRYFCAGVISKPAVLLIVFSAPCSMLFVDWRMSNVAKRLAELAAADDAGKVAPLRQSAVSVQCESERWLQWAAGVSCFAPISSPAAAKQSAECSLLAGSLFADVMCASDVALGMAGCLLGLVDGRVLVCHLPGGVRGAGKAEKEGGVRTRLLADIREPVLGIFAVKLPQAARGGAQAWQAKRSCREAADVLVLVGVYGSIHVLESQEAGLPLRRRTYNLRTTIEGAQCSGDGRLVYWCRGIVHVIDLVDRSAEQAEEEEEEAAGCLPLAGLLLPTRLPLGHQFLSMSLLPMAAGQDVRLAGMTTKGTLVSLCLPVSLAGVRERSAALVTPGHLQHRMKELLEDVTRVSDRQQLIAIHDQQMEAEVATIGAAIRLAAELRGERSLLSCSLAVASTPRVYQAACRPLVPVTLSVSLSYSGKCQPAGRWALVLTFTVADGVTSRSIRLPDLFLSQPLAIEVPTFLDMRMRTHVAAALAFLPTAHAMRHQSSCMPSATFTLQMADRTFDVLDLVERGHSGEPASGPLRLVTLQLEVARKTERMVHTLLHERNARVAQEAREGDVVGSFLPLAGQTDLSAALSASTVALRISSPLASFVRPEQLIQLLLTGKPEVRDGERGLQWMAGPYPLAVSCAIEATKGGLDRVLLLRVEVHEHIAEGLRLALLLRAGSLARQYSALFVRKTRNNEKVTSRMLAATYERLFGVVGKLMKVHLDLEAKVGAVVAGQPAGAEKVLLHGLSAEHEAALRAYAAAREGLRQEILW